MYGLTEAQARNTLLELGLEPDEVEYELAWYDETN